MENLLHQVGKGWYRLYWGAMLLASTLDDGTPVTLPGIVPKLLSTPGQLRSRAPTLGEHTDHVLNAYGIDAQTREQWRARGII